MDIYEEKKIIYEKKTSPKISAC